MTDTPQGSVAELSDDLFAGLGIDYSEYEYLAKHPEATLPRGRTTRFTVGERTTTRGSLTNGAEVESIVTIERCVLNRVTILEQHSEALNRDYLILSGSFNPIRADISMILRTPDQREQEVSMFEFLRHLHNKSLANPIPPERFGDFLRNIGMPLGKDMVLFFQHMGADEEKLEAFIKLLTDTGIKETTQDIPEDRRGRIRSQYTFGPNQGLEVKYFEMGRVDRTRSRVFEEGIRQGQGFLNFVDALQSNFARQQRLRAEYDAMRQQLETDRPNLDQATLSNREAQLAALASATTSWMNNLAGAQERMTQEPDGSWTKTGRWDVVAAPVGRMGVMKAGSLVEIDLWKSNQSLASTLSQPDAPTPSNETADATQAAIDAAIAGDDDETNKQAF